MSMEQQSVIRKPGGISGGALLKLALGGVLALALAGCEAYREDGVKIGRKLVTNAKANHPIRVSKKMVKLKIPVRRGDYGLSAEKKVELGSFISRYRREGEGRIILRAPVGQANEVAAFEVLNNVRDVMKRHGLVRKMVKLSPYQPSNDPEAPIVVSYLGYKAIPPKCGPLTRDMGGDGRNLPYEQLACANQANMAMMIANPKDLIEPRGMTPRSGERRDVQWGKFVNGEYMGRKKSKEQTSKLGDSIGD